MVKVTVGGLSQAQDGISAYYYVLQGHEAADGRLLGVLAFFRPGPEPQGRLPRSPATVGADRR